ncbi:hypothetical protein CUJ84_Chr002201 [Rhizobium leguminosarum]|uniref:Uncharacterized protein n=1 Tax=Rhizobium leguminosarum TaxID=384 RepID=A0A2K9Z2V8_RHILE|nr:hypothetical protein CUJ84_Chr002201 [Rhizobium leguminosarum]
MRNGLSSTLLVRRARISDGMIPFCVWLGFDAKICREHPAKGLRQLLYQGVADTFVWWHVRHSAEATP